MENGIEAGICVMDIYIQEAFKRKMERDFVTTALWGRIYRKQLEGDAESLAIAIAKQVGIPLEECRKIIVEVSEDAMNLSLISNPKPNVT